MYTFQNASDGKWYVVDPGKTVAVSATQPSGIPVKPLNNQDILGLSLTNYTPNNTTNMQTFNQTGGNGTVYKTFNDPTLGPQLKSFFGLPATASYGDFANALTKWNPNLTDDNSILTAVNTQLASGKNAAGSAYTAPAATPVDKYANLSTSNQYVKGQTAYYSQPVNGTIQYGVLNNFDGNVPFGGTMLSPQSYAKALDSQIASFKAAGSPTVSTSTLGMSPALAAQYQNQIDTILANPSAQSNAPAAVATTTPAFVPPAGSVAITNSSGGVEYVPAGSAAASNLGIGNTAAGTSVASSALPQTTSQPASNPTSPTTNATTPTTMGVQTPAPYIANQTVAATPTLNSVAAAPSSGGNYTIKSGDTLSQIATSNGTTVAALQAANPSITDPNKIQVGQSLTLPSGGSTSSMAITPASTSASSNTLTLPSTGLLQSLTAIGSTPASTNPNALTLSTNSSRQIQAPAGSTQTAATPAPVSNDLAAFNQQMVNSNPANTLNATTSSGQVVAPAGSTQVETSTGNANTLNVTNNANGTSTVNGGASLSSGGTAASNQSSANNTLNTSSVTNGLNNGGITPVAPTSTNTTNSTAPSAIQTSTTNPSGTVNLSSSSGSNVNTYNPTTTGASGANTTTVAGTGATTGSNSAASTSGTIPSYGGLLSQLASQNAANQPTYQQQLDLMNNYISQLNQSKQNEAGALAANYTNPIPLEFQTGRAQVLTNQYLAQQNALQDAVNQYQTGVSNALTNQGQINSALGTSLGAAAPVQVAPQNTYTNPVTGQSVAPIGGTGNAYTNWQITQNNAALGTQYQQQVQAIQNSRANLSSIIGTPATAASGTTPATDATGIYKFLSDSNINPNATTAINSFIGTAQNQLNPGAMASWAAIQNDIVNKIAPIIASNAGIGVDQTTSELQKMDFSTLSPKELNQFLSNVDNLAAQQVNVAQNAMTQAYGANSSQGTAYVGSNAVPNSSTANTPYNSSSAAYGITDPTVQAILGALPRLAGAAQSIVPYAIGAEALGGGLPALLARLGIGGGAAAATASALPVAAAAGI